MTNPIEAWRIHLKRGASDLWTNFRGACSPEKGDANLFGSDEFQPIRDRLFAKQLGYEDTDYVFDIPIELFASLGGIRYDRDIPGAGPEPWEILDRREPLPLS